jgi:hypothetical protein
MGVDCSARATPPSATSATSATSASESRWATRGHRQLTDRAGGQQQASAAASALAKSCQLGYRMYNNLLERWQRPDGQRPLLQHPKKRLLAVKVNVSAPHAREKAPRIRFTLVSEIADCPPLCYLDHTICPLRSASHSPLDESLASLLVERQLLGAKPHGRLEARGPSGRKATRAVGPSRSPSWRLGPGPGWCLDRTGAPRSRLRLSHRMMCEASGLARGSMCGARSCEPEQARAPLRARRIGRVGACRFC